MAIPLYHVDAFTNQPFAGNPAAVCPLGSWLDDDTLRALAAENNLSETAYFVAQGEDYQLRWFTPRAEVKLCGHGTLATAFVIMNFFERHRELVRFNTRYKGTLTVRRVGDQFVMDFPAATPRLVSEPPGDLLGALRSLPLPRCVLQADQKYFAVYDSEAEVRAFQPDFAVLEKLHPFAVAITAPGADVDFVSRYFAPSYGVLEDPVTGSTHCSLTPYWAERLKKKNLHARQLSARGGEICCESQGERVILRGNAVLTLRGELCI